MVHYLGLFRQFGEYLSFQAPQYEGGDHPTQLLHVAFIAGRLAEALLEMGVVAQQAGIDKVEQTPEFPQMVFHRCATERQPKLRRQGEEDLGPLCGGIFDLLRLIGDEGGPVVGLQRPLQRAQQPIVEQHHITGLQRCQGFLPIVVLIQGYDIQLGGEAGRFLLPVEHQGLGYYHQRRSLLLPMTQQCQCLQGFSQPHIIGQTGTKAVLGQGGQPVGALFLIIAQRGEQCARYLHCLSPLVLQLLPACIALCGDALQQAT